MNVTDFANSLVWASMRNIVIDASWYLPHITVYLLQSSWWIKYVEGLEMKVVALIYVIASLIIISIISGFNPNIISKSFYVHLPITVSLQYSLVSIDILP